MTSMNEGQPTTRHHFLDAALWFVQSAAQLPGVQRIALIGSILTNRPSPKDIDLVVYIAGDADLAPLASLARRLKGRLQSHNRGADVFLADEGRHYLGRTCSWKDADLGCVPHVTRCTAAGGRICMTTSRLFDFRIRSPPLRLLSCGRTSCIGARCPPMSRDC